MATLSGDFSLTLVDSLDLLAVMGNTTEFQRAVKLVIDTVHFDKSNVVQVRGTLEVFEAGCVGCAVLVQAQVQVLVKCAGVRGDDTDAGRSAVGPPADGGRQVRAAHPRLVHG